jgi:ceramide glucosyltransferase
MPAPEGAHEVQRMIVKAISEAAGVVCIALAVAGCIYTLAATFLLRRFRSAAREAPQRAGVTILKPLAGAIPGLYEDLGSFCDQDYRGPVQILFSARDSSDPAVAVAQRLIAERPGCDLEVVLHGPARGPNPKVANLVGLESRIRHEIVVLADADIDVTPDYLQRTVAALMEPGVGAVTVLYHGTARDGIWARIASMGIDYHFVPSVVVGLALGLARPCFGSTIALRRETLASIGGFAAFADHLADDYAIGEAVRARGMKVVIPPFFVAHDCAEQSAGELLRHELRWARTLRAVRPLGFAASVVTHPLPLALLGAALTGFGVYGVATIGAALACRLVLQLQADHTLRVPADRWWLVAARDLLAFGVHVANYFVSIVTWGGRRFRVRPDGTLVAIGEPKT